MSTSAAALLPGIEPVSMSRYDRDFADFSEALGASFRRYGFAVIADHGLDQQVVDEALERTKAFFALPEEVLSGQPDLDNLDPDDEAAIAQLVQVKGIGRWSAEVYLLFAEGRPDVWPAGDLVVQIQTGRILGLPEKPGERRVRELAEPWRPHRGAAAIFAWHHYRHSAAPL